MKNFRSYDVVSSLCLNRGLLCNTSQTLQRRKLSKMVKLTMLHLLRNAAQYGSSLRRSFNCGLSANVPTFERLIAVDFLSNQIILGSRGLVECS